MFTILGRVQIITQNNIMSEGYGLLKGKKGIIFGALDERSIAWRIALACKREGAEFVLSNAPIALRLGALDALGEETGAPIIPCDVTSDEEIVDLVNKTKEHFGGGVDFILHAIGMSPNIRKKKNTQILIISGFSNRWIFRPFLYTVFYTMPMKVDY